MQLKRFADGTNGRRQRRMRSILWPSRVSIMICAIVLIMCEPIFWQVQLVDLYHVLVGSNSKLYYSRPTVYPFLWHSVNQIGPTLQKGIHWSVFGCQLLLLYRRTRPLTSCINVGHWNLATCWIWNVTRSFDTCSVRVNTGPELNLFMLVMHRVYDSDRLVGMPSCEWALQTVVSQTQKLGGQIINGITCTTTFFL